MGQSAARMSYQAPEATMYDLNDGILLRTFAHLDLEELEVMADVCSTFRRVAQKELVSRYKRVRLRISQPTKFVDGNAQRGWGKTVGTLDVGQFHWGPFLQRFGNAITSIVACEHGLMAITEYCSESLMELQIGKVKWSREIIWMGQPIFSRLRKLHLNIYYTQSDEAYQLISSCVELNSLTLVNSKIMCVQTPIALPQLKTLDLSDTSLDATAVDCLISLNPQLEEIKLPYSSASAKMMEMVSKYVPSVAKLGFVYRRDVIVDWKIFKNLKSLDIILYDMRTIPAFKSVAEAAVPLEHLRINTSVETAELVEEIVKFERLKELDLTLCDKLTMNNVLTVVRNLPRLKKLILGHDDSIIATIPDIIESGPKLQTLHCGVPSGTRTLDKDSFVKIRNAILDYSEHRPFRLRFVNYSFAPAWHISNELVQANANILKLEMNEYD